MIFGQIIKCAKNNNTYIVKPKYLLGCGLNELKEFPEIYKKFYSMKFHYILTIIGGFSILHFLHIFLFEGGDKNLEKFLKGKKNHKIYQKMK
jgi:hypothetical protein